MSRDDAAERGRAEPIDVEFEPAGRNGRGDGGIGAGTAVVITLLAAGLGAVGGAVGPRLPAVQAALDGAFPLEANEASRQQAAETEAALSGRLAAIEALVNAPAGQTAGETADLSSRVFALQASLSELNRQLEQMPSSQEVSALVAEVRRLQEELPAVAAEARSAAIAARASYAVVAAAEASRSSGPFEQAHAALAALLPNDENVAALEPLARTGAPTRSELRERFERLDSEILRAATQAQAGAGFWGRIQAALAQWIVVRRSGEGDTPAGAVERASQALAGDNLAAAVEELSALSGAPRRVADPWIADARRRLEIDQRLAAIRTELSRGS